MAKLLMYRHRVCVCKHESRNATILQIYRRKKIMRIVHIFSSDLQRLVRPADNIPQHPKPAAMMVRVEIFKKLLIKPGSSRVELVDN